MKASMLQNSKQLFNSETTEHFSNPFESSVSKAFTSTSSRARLNVRVRVAIFAFPLFSFFFVRKKKGYRNYTSIAVLFPPKFWQVHFERRAAIFHVNAHVPRTPYKITRRAPLDSLGGRGRWGERVVICIFPGAAGGGSALIVLT